MALTKVTGGILSQPIDLGITTATTGFFSGIVTAQSVRVLGDLTVDGSTTTLDTVVTEVDRLEVAANNVTVGVAITQSGTGDILKLYDSSTPVFVVKDGGRVGIGTDNPTAELDIEGAAARIHLHDFDSNQSQIAQQGDSLYLNVDSEGNGGGTLRIRVGGNDATAEKLRISSNGSVGIKTNTPGADLHVYDGVPEIRLQDSDGTDQFSQWKQVGGNARLQLRNGNSDGSFIIQGFGGGTATDPFIKVESDGTVGIQTSTGTNTVNIGGAQGLGVKFHNFTSGNSTFFTVEAGDKLQSNVGGSGYYTWVTGGAEKMRLANNGRLGIGTNNALAPLDVYKGTSATDVDLFAVRSKTGAFNIQCSDTDAANPEWRLRTYANEDLVFSPGGTGSSGEKVRITSAGLVGIGTNDPGAQLEIYRNSAALGHQLRIEEDGTGDAVMGFALTGTRAYTLGIDNSDSDKFKLATGSDLHTNTLVSVTTGGDVGIGTDNTVGARLRVHEDGLNQTLQQWGGSLGSTTGQRFMTLFSPATDSGNDYFRFQTGNAFKFQVDTKDALCIKSDGNIGIGTDSPTASSLLTLAKSANPTLEFKDFTNNAQALITGSAGGQLVFTTDVNSVNPNSDFIFRADSQTNEIVRFKDTGEVGIGTDNPTDILDINSDQASAVSDVYIRNHANLGGAALNLFTQGTYSSPVYKAIIGCSDAGGTIRMGAASDHPLLLLVNNAPKVTIQTSGKVGIGEDNPTAHLQVYRGTQFAGNPIIQARSNNGSTNELKFEIDGDGDAYFNGKVGIGITNPDGQLHISSGTSGDCRVYIEADTDNNNEGDNPFIIFKNDGGIENASVWCGNADGGNDNSLNLSAATANNGGIRFFTSSTDGGWETADERLRITSGGNVGIGTDSPQAKLDVIGNVAIEGNVHQSTNDGLGTKTFVLNRSYTMSTSSTDVLTLGNWGNSSFDITVFRRDTTSPNGTQIMKLYLAFGGSGTNMTSATIVQETKVTRGSIHTTTYSISEDNNDATLSVTGNDNGGESQSLTFYIIAHGSPSGFINVI